MCIVVLRCLSRDHKQPHKLKSQWSQANASEMPTIVCGGAELGGWRRKVISSYGGCERMWWEEVRGGRETGR